MKQNSRFVSEIIFETSSWILRRKGEPDARAYSLTTAGEIFPGGQVGEPGVLTENPFYDVGGSISNIESSKIPYRQALEAAHVGESRYFAGMIHEDLDKILTDIWERHKHERLSTPEVFPEEVFAREICQTFG